MIECGNAWILTTVCTGYLVALHMASANGHLDCIKLLLDNGAVRISQCYCSIDGNDDVS